jgi:hypothetical protein
VRTAKIAAKREIRPHKSVPIDEQQAPCACWAGRSNMIAGGAGAVFEWARAQAKKKQEYAAGGVDVDNSGAADLVGVIDASMRPYLERVDQGALVYPACKRKRADQESDIRSVWVHTRLEAARYLTMVPGRQIGLLMEPARQLEIFGTFLRRQPHEKTVIDFTGVPADDLVLAIIAGLNWLNHCALLASVDRARFSGTLRNFRRMVEVGQQWWSLEGAEARCAEMLGTKKEPPLMLYLVWKNYTVLSKEVASATMFGSSTERAVARRQKMLKEALAEHPIELDKALAELKETMSRFDAAQEPDDLLG